MILCVCVCLHICCMLPAVVELVAACSGAERELQTADEEGWSTEADPAGSIHPCPAVHTVPVPAGGQTRHINNTDTQTAAGFQMNNWTKRAVLLKQLILTTAQLLVTVHDTEKNI